VRSWAFTAARTAPMHLTVPRLCWERRLSCVVSQAVALEVQCQGGDRVLEEEYFLLTSSCRGDVLSRAVLLAHDDSMRLPIHLACDKNAVFSVLRSLLDADKGKALIGMPGKWGGESPPPPRCMRLCPDRYTHPTVVGGPSLQTSPSTRRAAGTRQRW
jgi:hypothetical protein